jgi:two-component system cell cycle sensor histidine kinase PleC
LSVNDAGINLCVQDNGKGIPEDQIARIVQPFEQLDNRYGQANGGTGLGLALVHALTEMHDGTFEIQSEVGVGTRVNIWLPCAETTNLPDSNDAEQVAA